MTRRTTLTAALLSAALVAAPRTATAGTVVLEVGVHVDAGTVGDVAADGASGQCTVAPSTLTCPADGPVTFRWGPGGDRWELTGDVMLSPGERGVAWVLAPNDAREAERERLQPWRVTENDVNSLFQRAGTVKPPIPSRAMLRDLAALASHPDQAVRRRAADALLRWSWRSSLGPLQPTAPVPIPPGVITHMATDEDVTVRRKTAVLIRYMRPSERSEEAARALTLLAQDPRPGVRAAAIRSSGRAHLANATTVEEAWDRAMAGVSQPGPPGRASAATLAYLAGVVGPHDVLDPTAAVEETLLHHPEQSWKVWSRWRDDVPFRPDWALILMRDTYNLSPGLVRHWAEEDPDGLATVLHKWEPASPHSSRFQLVGRHLARTKNEAVLSALGLLDEPEHSQ